MSRYRLRDVLRHPRRFFAWWEELPYFRRYWWNEVLLSPGEGWLRWAPDWRERISYEPPDIDQWQVFPPLRRLWLAVYGWIIHPYLAVRRDVGWTDWPRLQDVTCLKSDDRKRLFR